MFDDGDIQSTLLLHSNADSAIQIIIETINRAD